jgi:hypothetical protein
MAYDSVANKTPNTITEKPYELGPAVCVMCLRFVGLCFVLAVISIKTRDLEQRVEQAELAKVDLLRVVHDLHRLEARIGNLQKWIDNVNQNTSHAVAESAKQPVVSSTDNSDVYKAIAGLVVAHADAMVCPAQAGSWRARWLAWWRPKKNSEIERQLLPEDCTDVHLPASQPLANSILCKGNSWCLRSPNRNFVLFQTFNGSLGIRNLATPHAEPRWLWRTPCPQSSEVTFHCSWAREPLYVMHNCKALNGASNLTITTNIYHENEIFGDATLDDLGRLRIGKCTFNEHCVPVTG